VRRRAAEAGQHPPPIRRRAQASPCRITGRDRLPRTRASDRAQAPAPTAADGSKNGQIMSVTAPTLRPCANATGAGDDGRSGRSRGPYVDLDRALELLLPRQLGKNVAKLSGPSRRGHPVQSYSTPTAMSGLSIDCNTRLSSRANEYFVAFRQDVRCTLPEPDRPRGCPTRTSRRRPITPSSVCTSSSRRQRRTRPKIRRGPARKWLYDVVLLRQKPVKLDNTRINHPRSCADSFGDRPARTCDSPLVRFHWWGISRASAFRLKPPAFNASLPGSPASLCSATSTTDRSGSRSRPLPAQVARVQQRGVEVCDRGVGASTLPRDWRRGGPWHGPSNRLLHGHCVYGAQSRSAPPASLLELPVVITGPARCSPRSRSPRSLSPTSAPRDPAPEKVAW